MKLKAQNTMEVITMVALVVVVVVSAFMFMNGKNSKLANLSAINSTSTKPAISKVNKAPILKTESATTPTSDAETAGALSQLVANMNRQELLNALANKTLNDILLPKTQETNEDIFTLADILNTAYLEDKDIKFFGTNRTNIPPNYKEILVDVAIGTKEKLGTNTNSVYELYVALLADIIY